MPKTRRNFGFSQKVAILKRCLPDRTEHVTMNDDLGGG